MKDASLLAKLTSEKRDIILICKRCSRRSGRNSNRPIRDQKIHCNTCGEETWHIVALAPPPKRPTFHDLALTAPAAAPQHHE